MEVLFRMDMLELAQLLLRTIKSTNRDEAKKKLAEVPKLFHSVPSGIPYLPCL